MFGSVDRELNAGESLLEPGIGVAPNPRATFLMAHGAALNRWQVIPYQLGFVSAPLWDHRSGEQQAVSIVGFVASSILFSYLAKPWVEERVGFFRPRTVVKLKPAKEAVRAQRWREAKYYAVLLAICIGVAMLSHFNLDKEYPTRGWMEHATGVWTYMAISDCVDRATDLSNLRARRLWNIVAAVVLACGFGFSGATVNSYAVLIVMLGVVNIVLALLDLRLMLHFAATPLELEEAHG